MKKIVFILFFYAFSNTALNAQFQKEIDAFAKADSMNEPAANSVLFVGSSSFNYWKDIKNYFPGVPIINRGFGGSSLTDVIQYANETIIKYKPKQIYIYCGENDIAGSDTVSPETVLIRFKNLFQIIRTNLDPTISVAFVSIKPSVARWTMEARMVKSNALVKAFLATQKHTIYLDVHNAMLDAQGNVFKDIFVGDNLHMNAKGYAIWQKIIAPTILHVPVIQTASGKIEGTVHDGIQIFKGIPFAQAPVGDLRWKAPQPVIAWDGVKKCVDFSASPVQDEPIPFMCWSKEYLIPKEPINEDCLYLNVWSKPTKEKKPVLVYIYGGGFRSGGAACPIYDGEAVANKDVVFVSINYRVGVFGFLAHPALTKESPKHSSGNYALLDMVAALEWVKKNIASFGGDPSRVTIAGQSAGAFAVNFLCATPLTKGLISGAIAESGGSVLPSSIRPSIKLKEAEAMGSEFAKKLNCATIADLRNKSAKEILKATGGLSAPFEDGYVIPESVLTIYTKGKQNDVPLILGWNADDKIPAPPLSAANYKLQIQKRFGNKAAEVLAQYPGENDAEAAISQGDMNRDETFGVQGFAWANAQLKSGKSPVFMYNFNKKLPAYTPASDFGAFHTGEVVYAYDNLKTVDRPWEKADFELATAMSAYWVNFVKTGNPNGGALVKWPAYENAKEQVLILDSKIESKKLPTKAKLKLIATLL
jgi:para-nitrobenzyl esterase